MFQRLKLLTAGESHGPALALILEGIPSGLELTRDMLDRELGRRQVGYGRGERMKIESDRARIISGVRHGKTLGSPICIMIENKDYANWEEVMSVEPAEEAVVEPECRPRPGHADFAGMLKYSFDDARNVLERASARETAARTAAGAVAKALIGSLGVSVLSRVTAIGPVEAHLSPPADTSAFEGTDESPVRCPDPEASSMMMMEIDRAREAGDTLGGKFEVAAFGVPPGLGSYSHFEKRLDARIAASLMSIPSVKAVEMADGVEVSALPGSQVHDEILHDGKRGVFRPTNRAGGVEGGVSNGEPIIARAHVKPVPTLGKPLRTIDMSTLEQASALKERADTCVVPAAAVIGEAVLALALADAFLEKFGGDSMGDLLKNFEAYLERISMLWRKDIGKG